MKRVNMHDLQELVRLHRMKTGFRDVARIVGISPNTEREYRLALQEAGLLDGAVDNLPGLAELRAAVAAAKPPKPPPTQHVSSVAGWKDIVAKLLEDGGEATAIYDRLRLEEPEFKGSLSSIKRLCIRIKAARGIQAKDVVIPVDTDPGDVAQVDFGSVGKLWDGETGRMRAAYVFTLVLGFSRHRVDRIVFDQKIETWLRLHVEAFEELDGVPRTLVPDNLKAAVIRAAFGVDDDSVLNRSYREFARHYGFMVDPTPPRSPEKKGKVESGVKYVKRNFFAVRREQKDAKKLSVELARWVTDIAGMRNHGVTHRRPLEHFRESEQATLLPLPANEWEPVIWREPLLRRDCHALIEGARYSAPWRLIGKRLLARITQSAVSLHFDDLRVATHKPQPRGGRSTIDEHLPPERSEYRHRSRVFWVARAEKMGPDVATLVTQVFDSDDVLLQLTKVQSIVTHLETFPLGRAQAACRRASYFGSFSYGAMKAILSKGLDMQPLPEVVIPADGDVERPRFARTVQELLDLPLEKEDASH